MSKSLIDGFSSFQSLRFVVILQTQIHGISIHHSRFFMCVVLQIILRFKPLSKSVEMMCNDEMKAFLEGMSIAHYLQPRTDFPKEIWIKKAARPVLQMGVDKIVFLEIDWGWSEVSDLRRTSLFDRCCLLKLVFFPRLNDLDSSWQTPNALYCSCCSKAQSFAWQYISNTPSWFDLSWRYYCWLEAMGEGWKTWRIWKIEMELISEINLW